MRYNNSAAVYCVHWWLGLVNNVDRHISEVVLRWAWLLLRWVIAHTILVCTQPPTLSRTGKEYRPRDSGNAVRLGR